MLVDIDIFVFDLLSVWVVSLVLLLMSWVIWVLIVCVVMICYVVIGLVWLMWWMWSMVCVCLVLVYDSLVRMMFEVICRLSFILVVVSEYMMMCMLGFLVKVSMFFWCIFGVWLLCIEVYCRFWWVKVFLVVFMMLMCLVNMMILFMLCVSWVV